MVARAPPSWLTLLTLAEGPAGGDGGGGGIRRNGSFNFGWMLGGGDGSGDDDARTAPRGHRRSNIRGGDLQLDVTLTSSVEVAVHPDERVLRQLKGSASPAAALRAAGSGPSEADGDVVEDGRARLLREHFEQLTASFLQPL